MNRTGIVKALVKAHGHKGALHIATRTAKNFERVFLRTKSANARSLADNWNDIASVLSESAR